MGLFSSLRRRAAKAPAPPVADSPWDAPEPARAPWFGTDAALLSDTGPAREHNEDFVLALSQSIPGQPGERIRLAALADGMGGHQAGETASRIAVETAIDCHRRDTGRTTARNLIDALQAANRAVFEHAGTDPSLEGMGTTLVLMALTDGGAWCAWVGDSRAYWWRNGSIEQLTRDDTVVRELLDDGVIQPEQVANHPDRSVLSQALGTKPALRRLNLIGPVEMALGDRFLLCSDGLHDVVPADVLADLLGGPDARSIVDSLLQRAVANRADDNISCIVLGLQALPDGAPTLRPTVTLPRDPT